MQSQIWCKIEDKWAYILMLRGPEIFRLKITGMPLGFKGKVKGVLEALEQGTSPNEVKASSVEVLDARNINKAEVAPGNNSLTLHADADAGAGAKTMSFTSAESDAPQILSAILAQSGRTFQETKEDIGVVEALIPPGILAVVGGLLFMGVFDAASKLAAGDEVEAHGRKRGLKQMLIWAAEILGTNGTIAVGVVLLILVITWSVRRITHRPQRTVWLPDVA